MKPGHPQVSVYPAALEALENFALKGSYSCISPRKQFRPGDCFPTLVGELKFQKLRVAKEKKEIVISV